MVVSDPFHIYVQTIDFACIETQIGNPGNILDCEILELEQAGLTVPIVRVPSL